MDMNLYYMFCKNNCPISCKERIIGTDKCPIILFDRLLENNK